ncbi:MAG: hypothetical protein ACOY3Y_09500 [Acidobacteriota bacterium]
MAGARSIPEGQRQRRLAGLAPPLIPFLLWAAMLPWMGRLPANDYYGIVAQVADGDRFSADPLRWLRVKSNEHSVVLPALAYATNLSLGDGDNRALSALALVMLLSVSVALARLLPWPPGDESRPRPVWALLVALPVFTPAAAHSIVLGFSGTIWFMANLFAVVALGSLARLAARPSAARAGAVLAAAYACTLSYSTSLALWAALLLGAWLFRLPRRFTVTLVAGSIPAVLYLTAMYTRPAHHPAPVLDDPLAIVRFTGVYLGGPLASNQVTAGALGIAGLLVAAAFARRWVGARTADGQAALLPWLLLQVYVVGNAVGTAVARAGLGGARSSRYASVAILFWIALLVTGVAPAIRRASRPSGPGRAVGLALAASLVVATWTRGAPVLSEYLTAAARQPLAELALVHGVNDDGALAIVSPRPDEVWRLRNFLAARRAVPFDRAAVSAGARVTVVGEGRRVTETTVRATDAVAVADGRALRLLLEPGPDVTATARLAVVAEGGVCGEVRDTTAPWPARSLRRGEADRRWEGYLAAASACRPLLLGTLTERGVVPLAELALGGDAASRCPPRGSPPSPPR